MLAFIFIAGIQPKTKVLDTNPRRCPICGRPQAYEKRVDHYLSLFFIPLVRVKRGDPFIACDSCEGVRPGFGPGPEQPSAGRPGICRQCGKAVSTEFRFCPHCGKEIDG